MKAEQRIKAFARLGEELEHLSEDEYKLWLANAQSLNPWFTEENLSLALSGICNYLKEDKLQQWLKPYSFKEDIKTVGIVMAGNIPLVGFHDYLSVLISGHRAAIKLSSKDPYLLPMLHKKLVALEPFFSDKADFVERLTGVDAYIATGSNNTARYFRQYFARKPHIIRKNRTSVAVLTGKETNEQLSLLSDDIFQYFGLGCRNVTFALTPPDYNWTPFFEACEKWNGLIDHTRYRNNYEYNRSVLLVNSAKHLDNGFLLMQHRDQLHSPIGVLNAIHYSTKEEVTAFLAEHEEEIQCVVGNEYIPFGKAQQPEVWDYADGVDTLAFLAEL